MALIGTLDIYYSSLWNAMLRNKKAKFASVKHVAFLCRTVDLFRCGNVYLKAFRIEYRIFSVLFQLKPRLQT